MSHDPSEIINSRNIYYYYQCWKQLLCLVYLWKLDPLMNRMFKRMSFLSHLITLFSLTLADIRKQKLPLVVFTGDLRTGNITHTRRTQTDWAVLPLFYNHRLILSHPWLLIKPSSADHNTKQLSKAHVVSLIGITVVHSVTLCVFSRIKALCQRGPHDRHLVGISRMTQAWLEKTPHMACSHCTRHLAPGTFGWLSHENAF